MQGISKKGMGTVEQIFEDCTAYIFLLKVSMTIRVVKQN
jgi:hypothetical protein